MKITDPRYAPAGNKKLEVSSQEAVELMRLMLNKDEKRRPSAADCLNHRWFLKFEAALRPPPLSVGITQCLECYALASELKKAIYLLIAHQCSLPVLSELREVFTHLDTSNNGQLPRDELRGVL